MLNAIIADDDEVYCMVVRDFLADRGYQSTIVHSSGHLRTLLLTLKPELLILDMQMPGGGGPAALSSFLEMGVTTMPIIICSGMPIEHQEKWARNNGLLNFRCQQKPLNFPKLSSMIDALR